MARKRYINFAKDLYNSCEVYCVDLETDTTYALIRRVGIPKDGIECIDVNMTDATVSVYLKSEEVVIFKIYPTKYKDEWDIVARLLYKLALS